MPRYCFSTKMHGEKCVDGTPHIPCDFIDADGTLIDLPAFLVDTDTGEVLSFVENPDLSEYKYLVDWDKGEMITQQVFFKAPLKMISKVKRLHPGCPLRRAQDEVRPDHVL